jgi:formylglycine-generating enzyme required for sulfatase activity
VEAATGAAPGATDPIVALASRYEWELDAGLAAAEAGLRRDEFLKRLDRSKELTATFGILQTSGGTVQRSVWEDHLGEVVREMRLGEYQPMPKRPATAAPPPVKQDPDTITNSIGMKLKRIRAGEFLMGTPGEEGQKEHPHEVKITRPFAIGIYPVTQEQFLKVMGRNPSQLTSTVGGRDTGQHPVESVSWKDAVEFCKRLSERPEERRLGRVYRLPTEAQWEYACRAGSRARFFFGADDRLLGDHAWHGGNAGDHTHPVGTRKPNAWGLFDMHGNVWQWCQDYYDADYYAQSQARDPSGPAQSIASMRVLRGGSFDSRADACRCAIRHASLENFARGEAYGFRVVLILDE